MGPRDLGVVRAQEFRREREGRNGRQGVLTPL